MNPRSRIVTLAAAAAGLVAVVGGVFFLQGAAAPTPQATPDLAVKDDGITVPDGAPQWKYVELSVAEEGPALPPLPAPARVEFDERRTASVGAPLAGRVDQVRVRLGDRVRAGDRLFSVRSGAWADLEKELLSARTQLADKTRTADRIRELVKLQTVAEKDLITAEAEAKEAELAVKAAEDKVHSLQVNSEAGGLYWVTAPRAGTVVDMDLTASQEVTPDREKPLCRISDLDQVLVIADVQQGDSADLHEGQPATVSLSGGTLTRPGTIERVSEVVDPLRRTVEVRVQVDNKDRALRPNSFVEVTPQAPAGVKRVLVPADAVVTDGGRAVVFVSESGGKLTRVTVTPGRRRDGQVEIMAGLSPGQRFVARGAILLENTIQLAD